MKTFKLTKLIAFFSLAFGLLFVVNNLKAENPPCADPCIPYNQQWDEETYVYYPDASNCPNCYVTVHYLITEACSQVFFYVEEFTITAGCNLSPNCVYNPFDLFNDAMDAFYLDVVQESWYIDSEVTELKLTSCFKIIMEEGIYKFIACGTDCCRYYFDPLVGYTKTMPLTMLCDDYVDPPGPPWEMTTCWSACGWNPITVPATYKRSLFSEFDNLTISPNPATDLITVQLPKTDYEKIIIKIIDLNGNVIATMTNPNSISNFDTKDWSNGTYLLKLYINNEETVKTFKFIISK